MIDVPEKGGNAAKAADKQLPLFQKGSKDILSFVKFTDSIFQKIRNRTSKPE